MFKYVKKIIKYYKKYRSKMFILILCSFVIMVISFFLPIISTKIVDLGLVNKDFRILIILSSILLGLYAVNGIVELIMEHTRLYLYNTLNYELQKKSFERLMSIKLDFFNNKNATAINDMIAQDVGAICVFAGPEAYMVLTGLISSVSGGVALFTMNWKIGLASMILIPFNLILTLVLNRLNKKNVRAYVKKSNEYNNWFGDSVNGIRDIRIYGVQNFKLSQIQEKQDGLVNLNIKRSMIYKYNENIDIFIYHLFSIGIYIYGGYLMLKNGITLGEVIAFETFSTMISSPIIFAIKMISQLSLLTPNFERHFEFMEYEDEKSGNLMIDSNSDIEFKNICFNYSPENSLIENLNFNINKGSKVALLGKNGVGKTTTLNMILRFLTPCSGNIFIDGCDISEYDIRSYRKLFSVVSQDVFMFNDTILNNICMYKSFEQKNIDKVLKLVNLEELVNERGLDYNVGTNGCKLSGGQRQKIALARALIYDNPIIILDEATSNLDLDTISIIKDLLHVELKDKTVICVTHTQEISDLFDVHIALG